LIEQGKASGLSIATQWDNVFFDFLLSGLGHFFNLFVAARIAAAAAVLIFFWGAFSFIAAVTDSAPWLVTPVLAAISYGWTFNAGLLNYFISIGLTFFAIAIVYRGWSRYWFVAVLLLPFSYLAHALALCWALGAAVYIEIARRVPSLVNVLLFLGGLLAIVAVRFYLRGHALTKPPSHSAMFYSGLDRVFFTNRYGIVVLVIWSIILAACLLALSR